MRIPNKKTVFFDLDHTLWDFEKNSALAFEQILDKNRVDVDVQKFVATHIPINNNYWKRFRDGEITQHQLRYGRLKDVFTALDYDAGDALINTLSDEYVASLPLNNHLYDGAIEILNYLKPNYSLHIITNGFHTVQESKLKNSGLDVYFTTVTNSENAGCKKPHPAIFEYALAAANAQKHHSIMIGDCIEADVQGAIDYGIDAIFFNEHRAEAHPSIPQVNSLAELKNFL